MLKTLGLDDDLDPVEVVIEIEKAFDIAISASEVEAIFNVGQLFDLLRGKVQASDANRKCASAMAFYRIRSALNDLRVDIGRSPSYDLSPLHRVYTKSFVKLLEERSGLRLPQPAFSLVGKVGQAFVLVGVFGAVAAMFAALPLTFISVAVGGRLPTASIILLLGGAVAGGALLSIDAGRLPTSCRTLGALAARAASLSYGRLLKQGADGRDSRIWKALVEILSDFATQRSPTLARAADWRNAASRQLSEVHRSCRRGGGEGGTWPEAEASARARCFRSLRLTGRALPSPRSSKMTRFGHSPGRGQANFHNWLVAVVSTATTSPGLTSRRPSVHIVDG
jgi:hypothetical protein